MEIATPANANMGFYCKKSTEKSLGTTVQSYNEQNGLTFNFGSRPIQKNLGDEGGSGATSCGENRREPSSSAPEDPHGHWGPADEPQPLNERICMSDECFSKLLNGCLYQYDWTKIKIYKLAYVFLFLINDYCRDNTYRKALPWCNGTQRPASRGSPRTRIYNKMRDKNTGQDKRPTKHQE